MIVSLGFIGKARKGIVLLGKEACTALHVLYAGVNIFFTEFSDLLQE